MILALDIGTTVGWARSSGACGAETFAYDDHGRALAVFSDWIERMLDEAPIITLAIEPPVMRGGFNHRLTFLMEGVAHMHAYTRDIPRTQRHSTVIRKWLLGFGVMPKQPGVSKKRRDEEMDKLITAAVLARGFRPASEHAADAAALICMLELRMPRESALEVA